MYITLVIALNQGAFQSPEYLHKCIWRDSAFKWLHVPQVYTSLFPLAIFSQAAILKIKSAEIMCFLGVSIAIIRPKSKKYSYIYIFK